MAIIRDRRLSVALALAVVAGVGLAGAGCSSSSNVNGTGGAGARGTGGAGTSGTGGSTSSTGGATGSGSGGATGTGSGGDTGTGTGGDNGTIATGGAGCPNTLVYNHMSTFGSIFDGWVVAMNSTPALVPMAPDGGAGASGTMLSLDTMDGSPAMTGSARLAVPFSEAGQQVLFANNFTGVNLTGTVITAQIKLDSGLNTNPTDTGRAYIVVKTTSTYNYSPGPAVNLDRDAGWVTLTYDADLPAGPMVPFGYVACDVREIDIVVETGATGTYAPAVVHIDTIAVTSKSGADGGTGQ